MKSLSDKFRFNLHCNRNEFSGDSAEGIKNVRRVILTNVQVFEHIFGLLEIHPCLVFLVLKSLLKEEEENLWNYFLSRNGNIFGQYTDNNRVFNYILYTALNHNTYSNHIINFVLVKIRQ